ncbi:FtsQ-type POTRA domain-containing protein [Corynebacterium sp. H128]|uniref:cell division protein FtsQ/DivIB n=1 Tax=Corynebacterium sp. H128 TaxID=3133427 RepID=UPI00309F3A00
MKKSRKLGLGIGLGVNLVAALAVVAALFLPLFQVAKIEVSGNSHTAVEEIDAASSVALGTPLIRVNTTTAAHNVAQLPWIAKVSVDRAMPDTVKVTVEERQALMFARRSDGEHLFDATGRPFVIETPPLGCTEVTGTKEDDPVLFADVATAITALDPGAREKLERVDAPNRFELRLHFAGGKEVYWGSTEQAHDKAKATSTVIQRDGARWNVSAPGMVTVLP